MMTVDKKQLKCAVHGHYEKLSNDPDQQCPECDQGYTQIKRNEGVTSIAAMAGMTKITVKCDVHGEYEMEVPAILSSLKRKCVKCVEASRQEEIKRASDTFIEETLVKSGLPVQSLKMTFADVDRTRSQKQTKIIERLITYIKQMIEAGTSEGSKNLMFSGNMGTGKTLFASITLQNIARRSLVSNITSANDIKIKGGLAFTFISEQMLMNAITASWGDNSEEKTEKLLSRLSSKAILCIDDVGTVTSKTQHLLDAYAVIFDERYKRGLPTIITSNMTHEGVALAIGARSADRFFERNNAVVFNFDWNGYRTPTEGTDELEIF